MNLLARLLCRLTAHKWRKLRKADDVQAIGAKIFEQRGRVPSEEFRITQFRVCDRCSQTRLARRRGGKA